MNDKWFPRGRGFDLLTAKCNEASSLFELVLFELTRRFIGWTGFQNEISLAIVLKKIQQRFHATARSREGKCLGWVSILRGFTPSRETSFFPIVDLSATLQLRPNEVLNRFRVRRVF